MFGYSIKVRNARLDALQATIGSSPVLKLFSGACAADCEASDPSGLLATLQLPEKWMESANNGEVSKAGEWKGVAVADGRTRSFRICAKGGACGFHGTVSGRMDGDETGLVIDNPALSVDQEVRVNDFRLRSR